MADLKAFIYVNNIPQKDIAAYLGVSKGYISQTISGKKELSEGNLSKLVNNPYGWDVSMLTESPVSLPDPEPTPASDMAMVNRLLQLLEEKERSHAALLEILKEKDETIRQLIIEITALKEKRGDAKNVITSSDANVG